MTTKIAISGKINIEDIVDIINNIPGLNVISPTYNKDGSFIIKFKDSFSSLNLSKYVNISEDYYSEERCLELENSNQTLIYIKRWDNADQISKLILDKYGGYIDKESNGIWVCGEADSKLNNENYMLKINRIVDKTAQAIYKELEKDGMRIDKDSF